MAKEKFIVAQAVGQAGEEARPGEVLGKFRTKEFARHARQQMTKEAKRRKFVNIAIFHKGEFVERL